jgi:uncharacterized protein
MGLPLIAIPIASLFVDVEDAIVVIAFPNMLANAFLAVRERSSLPETRDLPMLATAGVAGAIAGTLLLVNIPEQPLVIAIIVAIVGYVVLFFAHPEFRVGPARSRRLAPVVGGVAGVFQGAVGISGPIVGSWIHSYRLPRGAHILSVTSLFFITGLTQLIVLIGSGELSGRVVATLLACVPVFAAIRSAPACASRSRSADSISPSSACSSCRRSPCCCRPSPSSLDARQPTHTGSSLERRAERVTAVIDPRT